MTIDGLRRLRSTLARDPVPDRLEDFDAVGELCEAARNAARGSLDGARLVHTVLLGPVGGVELTRAEEGKPTAVVIVNRDGLHRA